jgi:lipopolysaccharide export LptBFGC system permease protein LptF
MYSRLALAFLGVMTVLVVNEMLYKTKELYHLLFANVISMTELLIVWATLMPVVFYHLGPQVVTIALLIRFYLWRQHNEILTMRTMGLSCWQIALPGIMVGVCAAVFSAVMALYALPATIDRAMEIKTAAATRIAPGMLVEGVQNTISPQLSLSFQRWLSADIVGEVVVTQDRKPGDFTFVVAERGRFAEKDGVYVLVLENGSQLVHHSAEDAHHLSFDQLSIPLIEPERTPNGSTGFYDQPIQVLLNPPEVVRQDPQLLAPWLAEGHHRIVNPLRCIGCALLLLGVLIPGLQSYTELIVRLLLAIALSFAESSASTIAFVIAQRHSEMVLLVYLLPVIPGAIGALLLLLGDRHQPRWILLPALWRGKPRGPDGSSYATGVTFASRASLK